MTTTLAQTPLYTWHSENGGRMVDFAGWSMPVQYSSIITEHNATRNAAGLFDVSHMGRLRFEGAGACDFLNGLLTRCVDTLKPGQIRYSLVTNQAGGILDDVLIYCLQDPTGTIYYSLVVNASNRQKIVAWVNQHLAGVANVDFSDITLSTAMIAVQGPKALELVKPLVEDDPAELKYYNGCETKIAGHLALISRTGYTGEDGCEMTLPAEVAIEVWSTILQSGQEIGAMAAGLGARDTLRLEAAMPLYGHELNEQMDPFQAGLSFAVNLEDRSFPGCEVLAERKNDTSLPKRIGLELGTKRIAREGCKIFSNDQTDGQQIGEITSGSFSPTLNKTIAMGYVAVEHSQEGAEVAIDIRGRREPAKIVKLPFYKR